MTFAERLRPSEHTALRFLSYLAGPAANAFGGHLSYDTVHSYFNEVRGHFEAMHNIRLGAVFGSPLATLALRGVRKALGDTKQRARPMTLDDLRRAMAGLSTDVLEDAALRVVLLIAFFGALRLGNLCPSGPARKSASVEGRVVAMEHCELQDWAGGERLVVTLVYSKTIQFQERVHRVRLDVVPEASLCPVRALKALRRLRAAHPERIGPLGPVARYGTGAGDVWTCESVLRRLEQAVPAVAGNPHEKGHLTRHSFRRGFVKLAIERGVPPESVMLHGDWKHLSTVRDYAAGAAVVTDVVRRVWG